MAGVGIAALVLVVVLGRTQQEQYLDDRYRANVAPQLDAGFRSTPQWTPLQKFGKRETDARIGVVGRASAFGQYFFYGDDLSNYVQYLGKELRRGTFRQIADCNDLRATINAGRYDYIVVTPRIRRETSIPPEIYWVGGGLVGVLIARLLPGPIKGLEFALCALFTVLTLDAFRSRRDIPSALLAGASIGIALVVAAVGLLLVRYTIIRRTTGRDARV